MEPPSAKLPVLFQNERKLRQATLPFEIMKISSKTDSPLLKRQEMSSCGKMEEDGGVRTMEITEEAVIREEKHNSHEWGSSQIEVEIDYETVVHNEVSNSKIETDSVKEEESNSSAIVLLGDPNEVIVDKRVGEPTDGRMKGEDNSKTNKRKLESTEKIKEQKPPKRAKLIYNIDKIGYNQGTNVSNVNSEKVKSGNSHIEGRKLIDCNNILLSDNSIGKKNNIEGKSETDQVEKDKSVITEQAVIVVEQSSWKLYTDRGSTTTATASSKDDPNYIENIDLDSSSSVELLFPAESNKKSDGDIYTSPSFKNEKCSPSGKVKMKRPTPKQLERKAEIAKKREEIQQERERKKREKHRMKEEKEEERARLKQEKEEIKKKLREEKEKKKLAEIEMKNEEKRKKEEERRKKEEQKLEDKRKKEELLKKKEEEQEMQKKKITKEAEAFSSFFKKYDSKTVAVPEDDGSLNEVVFIPFTVKADMRVAPVNRNPMDEGRRKKFEELYQSQLTEVVYLEELRSGAIVPKKSGNTWPLEEKYEDVIVVEEGLILKDEVIPCAKKFNDRRPKLLQFGENRRPAYWGTWRKKSKNIGPRKPLAKDEIFNYEEDSDEEWEEEEPGESLHGSDDEKESEDEYEVDNEFFVPHGYLSDDENPEEEPISPEAQKAKLKLLGEEFDMERKEKTKFIKQPLVLGCFWFNGDSDESAAANPSFNKFLSDRKAILWTDDIPIPVHEDENADTCEIALSDSLTPTSNKEIIFPESAIPDLITLIYGSTNSCKKLAKAFFMQWNKIDRNAIGESEESTAMLSKARIARKIKELAKWEEFPEEGPYNGKMCWYVRKEVREKFGLSDLSVLSQVEESSDIRYLSSDTKKTSPSLITKFTKVLTEDERKNQITNVRKSMSALKPLTESLPNTAKHVTPLKCLQKLKDFWAKPSIINKYITITTADDIMIVDPPAKNELVSVMNSPEPVNGNDKVSRVNMDSLTKEEPSGKELTQETDDMEIVEVSEEENTSRNDYLEMAEGSADEETSARSNGVSAAEESSSKEIPEKINGNAVDDGSSSQPVNKYMRQPIDSKPDGKKRVAILFSAPRGCAIVKPQVATDKLTVFMDDVRKDEDSKVVENEFRK